MTEKRFYIKNERTIKDNQKYIGESGYVFSYKSDAEEVCDLLNCLAKENEQLKSRVGYLEWKIDRERISHQKQHEKWEEEIQKENLQLKHENNKWIVDYNGLNTEYQWLKDENNNLKSILEGMKDKNGEIWLMDGRIIRLKKVLKE